MTESDFKTLKTIRDQIAHGNPVKTLQGNNITHEMTLTDKLSLIIHYCISIDFGISTDEFIKSLGQTTHPASRGARINRDKIYKYDDSVLKIKIPAKDYQATNKANFPYIVFTSTGDEYHLDITASETTREFGTSGVSNHICDFLSETLNIKRSRIQYHSTIHVTSEENEKSIHGCCTVSKTS